MANGGGSSADSHGLTAAERLREKHEADEARRVMVEDVVDEEDISHPPPSMYTASESEAPPASADQSQPRSEKAAGKQRTRTEPTPNTVGFKSNGISSLNYQSEEAFPALGSGPKAPTPAPTVTAWGAKKPSNMNASAISTNGHTQLSSMASSRGSTPTSGTMTPASTNASTATQPRGLSMPHHMSMPGRHSERIQFAPSQLLPRDQMRKSLQDVLRGINKSSKARVEMRPGPNGVIVFEGTGPVDAARQALKDLAKEVGSKVVVQEPVINIADCGTATRGDTNSFERTTTRYWPTGCCD